jgi:hypothetical protein
MGLFPFSLEEALSKLPAEERDVETDIQRQLWKKLDEMHYSTPAITHAKRPKKSEKLPAGADYTYTVESDDDDDEEEDTVWPRRIRPAGDSSNSNVSTSSDFDESSDQEEGRGTVQKIVERLRRNRSLFNNERSSRTSMTRSSRTRHFQNQMSQPRSSLLKMQFRQESIW